MRHKSQIPYSFGDFVRIVVYIQNENHLNPKNSLMFTENSHKVVKGEFRLGLELAARQHNRMLIYSFPMIIVFGMHLLVNRGSKK